jgi:hypothetical protein
MGKPRNRPFDVLLKIEQKKPDECWPWIGKYKDELGYGRFDINGVAYRAHRVVYFYFFGGISLAGPRGGEEGLMVCHRCDNPGCCNPAHLFLGTHDDNMADKKVKGRAPHYESTKSPRAKLTAEDVFWMRMQKKYGATKKALAMLYEVSEATVSGACYGRHYQDVT